MPSNILAGVRVKIDRAKSLLAELDTSIAAFMKAKSFVVHPWVNSQTELVTERLWIARQIPDEWAGLIGDIVHNLRGSLDILACDLVRHNGKPELVKDTYFPISASAEAFAANGIKRLKGAGQKVIDVVTALKPYKGGDDHLWRLHRLDIMDKHQLMIPVGAALGVINLDVWGRARKGVVKGTRMVLRSGEKTYPLQNNALLGKPHPPYTRNWEGGMSVEYTFEIAFGEGQILDGEPVISTLQRFIGHTEGVISKIVKEALDEEFVLPEYEVVLVLNGKLRPYRAYTSERRTKAERLELLKKHKEIFKIYRVHAATPKDADARALSLNTDCFMVDASLTKKGQQAIRWL